MIIAQGRHWFQSEPVSPSKQAAVKQIMHDAALEYVIERINLIQLRQHPSVSKAQKRATAWNPDREDHMIEWLKAQLPSARRARQEAAVEAREARDHTAHEAAHQAWLASLPTDLRAQEDAWAWAELTPPSDRAHAIQRHLRWTTAPPDLPDGTTMATKIALLMSEATNAEGRFYLPQDVAGAFDGALDWCGLTAFLGGQTPALPLDTLFQLQRFYQTSPLYFLPSFLPRSHWRTTMFGKGRLWAEGMIRRLEGDVYTEPLFGLPLGQVVGEEDGAEGADGT